MVPTMVGSPRLHHFLTTLDLLGFTSEAQTYLYQNPFPFPRDACRIHNRLGLCLRVQKQMSENAELDSAVLFLVILVSTDLCAVESPESGNYIEVPPGTQKSPMQSV